MNFFDVLLLALALSVDAFTVSFSYGLLIKKNRFHNSLKLAAAVGAGQFLMPAAGWYCSVPVSAYVAQFDHWLVFLVFGILGLNIIINAMSTEVGKLDKNLTLSVLFVVGIATSIDAMAAGVSLYFAQMPIWPAAAFIGLTTFLLSFLAFHLKRFFKKLPKQKMEISAGVILILLGTKILCEHLFWS